MTDEQGRKPATEHTEQALQTFAASMPVDDGEDFQRVQRGFIARRENPVIENSAPDGLLPITWDLSRWAFVEGDAPNTVNPSLWRQAKLNGEHGLYEVIEGFYQVRSHDTSCVTFVRGDEGWVVIDPLTTAETAASALELVTEHLGERPVTAVIYTHSHVDHYGGVLGVLDLDRLAAGGVEVVAPEGFLAAAVAENVAAQPVMGRRAIYQFGMLLPWDERGHVDQGLGKGVPVGSSALVPPTVEITETGQELTLDGVRIVFQLTPDTEAPAEMHFYFPDHNALCLAENCTGTQHNVLTLRGAVVRDALSWSRYIDEAIHRFGDEVDVSFASHSWPRWGRDDVVGHMTNQRDLYRWLHDEAMRYANLGYTPDEIAAEVDLPPGLWDDWSCHGYYGTVSHNVRAVYQRYLGWYDGHPSSLHPYPAAEAAVRYVEFMGGMDRLLENARRSFDDGDYRWVAQVLRHAVFADPTNRAARELQADAFEQLGYQAEAGPWRDVYLMGAQELRGGTPELPVMVRPSIEVTRGMTLEQLFDYLAIRVNGPEAAALGDAHLVWHFVDDDDVGLALSNGTLHASVGWLPAEPRATVSSSRETLNELVAKGAELQSALDTGGATIDGDAALVLALWSTLTHFPMFFAIVEP